MGRWVDESSKTDVEFSFLKIFTTSKVPCIELIVWEYSVMEMLWAGLG